MWVSLVGMGVEIKFFTVSFSAPDDFRRPRLLNHGYMWNNIIMREYQNYFSVLFYMYSHVLNWNKIISAAESSGIILATLNVLEYIH